MWRVKKKPFFIFLACAGVVLSLFILLGRDKEPKYEGKPLSFWLKKSDFNVLEPDPETVKALHSIGPEAIPFLLRLVKTSQDTLPRKLVLKLKKANKLPGFLEKKLPEHWTMEPSFRYSNR